MARSRKYVGCGKTVTFSDFINCFTRSDVCNGVLSWSRRTFLMLTKNVVKGSVYNLGIPFLKIFTAANSPNEESICITVWVCT